MYYEVNMPAALIVLTFLLLMAGWIGYRFGWLMRGEQYQIDQVNAHVAHALQAQESIELCTCDTCTAYEGTLVEQAHEHMRKNQDEWTPPPTTDW